MNLTERFVSTVGKHFVTLSCVQSGPMLATSKTIVFSGFVIEVHGEWFYVTAGHVVRYAQEALNSGSELDRWRLGDQMAGDRFAGVAIPFDFDPRKWLIVCDEELGLDYAAMHLGGIVRAQLEAGGVRGIGSNAWGDHVTEYDHWALVGIPAESVRQDIEGVIAARFVVVPLEHTEEPAMAGKRAENQFYARLRPGSEEYFLDADGFSGGPVFALKRVGDRWLYNVIGIQSAWYRSIKVLAICPFVSLALALEEIVAEVHLVVEG